MKNPIHHSRTISACYFAWFAVTFCCLFGWPAGAASDTWTGGGAPDGNWQNANNWGGTAPSAADFLFFDTGNQLLATNNFANGIIFGNLSFNTGAEVFALSPVSGGDGSGIVLTNSVEAANQTTVSGGSVTNFSANPQTLNLPLTLSAGNHVISTAGGAGALNLGGNPFSRNADGTVQFVKGGGSINFTGSGLNTVNGILGGWDRHRTGS